MAIQFLADFFEKNSILYHKESNFCPTIIYILNGQEYHISFGEQDENKTLRGGDSNLSTLIKYSEENGVFTLHIDAENIGKDNIEKISARLGINSYMCNYPDWNEQFFPTLLRCEKTHFYGYYSTPSGRILAIASPSKIVSWSHNYNEAIYGRERHVGHRIYTSDIDFVNSLPQPSHHPESCVLRPEETKSAVLSFKLLDSICKLDSFVQSVTGAPSIKLVKYTVEKNEPTEVYTNKDFIIKNEDETVVDASKLSSECGRYLITSNDNDKTSQTSIYVRQPWSWYLEKAAINAVTAPQKASTHMESWLGFFTRFYDLKYYPDAKKKERLVEDFNKIFGLMFDFETGTVYKEADPDRIQNISMAVSLLTLAYHTIKDEKYLIYASKLVDRLIEKQTEDGAYRNGNTHYTCVSYIAKSMMEYYYTICRLPEFKEETEKCRKSIVAAINNLVTCGDDIQTEGQMTFEDGMISCEVLQIAMASIIFPDEFGAEAIALAEKLFDKHKCLQQRMIPDCRQRGGTIRFWESMYDVIIPTNFINSPHGWTAWKIYATYYLYLLTGKLEYLIDTMDTLGACVQCIDLKTEKLRWGFVSDPSVKVKLFVKDKGGTHKSTVIGEQYVDMISDWWKSDSIVHGFANPEIGNMDGIYKGASCDNDIHEVFKCMCETVLDKAFIHFENGELVCYNCFVENGNIVLNDKFINQLLVFSDLETEFEYSGNKLKINNTNTVVRIEL